jgi:LmbE family N-acetylglucosaminyl deacetylase
VLYIAAHPDDEDTQLITWLARGGYGEVAYLSLTRGDGGQNLIGDELGEALGVLRTQELLAARRIDGARQYFTRAYDFGFSKTAEETYTHWPRDSVLNDVMRIVRHFRPHILVSTFSGTPRDGHGHHQVSALLTRAAYDLAADTVRFPAREFGQPWHPLKLYRFARFSPEEATLRINVGEYDPIAGRSYAEIAGESRSQHKSQGFGTLQRRGAVWDLFRREHTRVNAAVPAERENSIFDGLPSGSVRTATDGSDGDRAGVDFRRPETALQRIARFRPRDSWSREHYERAAAIASGVELEAVAARDVVAAGDSVSVRYTLYNRGNVPVRLLRGPAVSNEGSVPADSSVTWTGFVRGDAVTQPWWLTRPRIRDLFSVPIDTISEEQREREQWPRVLVGIPGLPDPIEVRAPIVYRFADPVRGDVQRPLAVAPGVTVSPEQPRTVVRGGVPFAQDIHVTVNSSYPETRQIRVAVDVPPAFRVEPAQQEIAIPASGTRIVTFRVSGTPRVGDYRIRFRAETGGATFTDAMEVVEYPHIAPQRIYRLAEALLSVVDVRVPVGLSVGYIEGMADEGPSVLRELGVPVTTITPSDIPRTDLSRFSVIVVGPRAYEASSDLIEYNPRLFEYANAGGRLVVQFGQYLMAQPGILPFPITITRPPGRVTDETAPVRFTDSTAAELNYPNRITTTDLTGWRQERATFMPSTFDERYRTMLAMNDPGETPLRSAVLVAQMGRGTYVYTTLALFRQLEERHPGAVRLFVNLLSPPAPPARPAR